MSSRSVIWSPQPRQAEFMSRAEDECLYGGAAGGGKSDALVIEALRQADNSAYTALIVRKTFPQLLELIDKSRYYYPRIFPGAKYNESSHIWTFPSGAYIRFGSLNHPNDKIQYQGHQYAFVGIDELTHFTLDEYMFLSERNRAKGKGLRVYRRASANPGGVGHGWVKERFITAAPPMTTIWERVEWRDPKGGMHHEWMSRAFVPATLYDNKILMDNDPKYVARLAALPEADKAAMLYGDWDSFSGQVFVEWRNDPAHYEDRAHTHVIEPFRIPDTWRIWRSMDWGYTRPFSVGWYAVDHDKRIYRIRELYGCTGTPNVGVKWEPARVAQEIRRIEAEDPNLKGKHIMGVADPAIWQSDGTESIAALMERQRVYFERGDHARIPGKMQIHHRLAFDDNGVPMLYVFNTCKHAIRTLPALVYDETDVEDVDTAGEDHIYDELRYVCMQNVISPPPKAAKEPKPYNPLDTEEISYNRRYDFYRI